MNELLFSRDLVCLDHSCHCSVMCYCHNCWICLPEIVSSASLLEAVIVMHTQKSLFLFNFLPPFSAKYSAAGKNPLPIEMTYMMQGEGAATLKQAPSGHNTLCHVPSDGTLLPSDTKYYIINQNNLSS